MIKKKDITLKPIRTYSLLLICPLVLIVTLNVYFNHNMQQSMIKQEQASCMQVISSIEREIDHAKNIILDIATDRSILERLNTLKSSDGTIDLIKAKNLIAAIENHKYLSEIIEHYSIYQPEMEVLFVDGAATWRLEQVYNALFQYGELSYQEWKDGILSKDYYFTYLPAEQISLWGGSQRRVPLIKSAYTFGGKLSGQICAYIEVSRIEKMMSAALDIGACFMAVYGEDGNIIGNVIENSFKDSNTSIIDELQGMNDRIRVRGQEAYVVRYKSDQTGFNYEIVIPVQKIYRQLMMYNHLMIVVVGILSIIEIILLVFVSWKESKPLVQISKKLKLINKQNDEMDESIVDITHAVNNLLNQYDMLEERIEVQNDRIRHANLMRLMNGGFSSIDSLYEEEPGMRKYQPPYFGILLQIDGLSYEQEGKKYSQLISTIVSETLEQNTDCIAFSLVITERRIAILISGLESEEVKKRLLDIHNRLYNEYEIQVCFALGPEIRDILRCEYSFEMAEKLIDSGDKQQYVIIWQKTSNDSSEFYFTNEHIRQLHSFAAAGNVRAINELLDELLAQNEEKDLDESQTRMLISTLTDTFSRIAREEQAANGMKSEFDFYDYVKRVLSCDSLKKAISILEDGYSEICRTHQMVRHSQNIELAEKIKEYLTENYAQYDLCLTSIGTHFGLNEKYISSFYKEQTGETLSNALLRIRMEYANHLLEESEMSITDVAKKVGYINSDTFRKAYRRYNGYNPSQHSVKSRHNDDV